MLVLTRKRLEQIRIDDKITITVVRVKGNSVRIGIEAPPEMSIRRTELPPLPTIAEEAEEKAPAVAAAPERRSRPQPASGRGPLAGFLPGVAAHAV